ncbi:uncharacterized protein TNIN_8571 [Trichonephila inaurata madagascariensis]|uniref:DUF7043 domain-containing protein n=1 Tax=Trichonephila inaurata madagascariensis TaxID=2747483 RepID=A0A8X6XCI6_9ARAC|nr:uncharacterized protein TNIN_8571 [Trichonephila inaurata madagascariensis]
MHWKFVIEKHSVYEKDKDTFDISQSADPTCDGLVSPRDGSRIMKLTKTKHPTSGCQFPSWVTSTRHWHTLDGRMNYYFSHRNNSYRIVHQHTSHAETKVTCTDEVYSSPNSTTVVAYSMQGCSNGFVCLTFHQREKHIIEIQTVKAASLCLTTLRILALFLKLSILAWLALKSSSSTSGLIPVSSLSNFDKSV